MQDFFAVHNQLLFNRLGKNITCEW
jgi:hypothetical protein